MITALLLLTLQADPVAEFRKTVEDLRAAHSKKDEAAEAAAAAKIAQQLAAAIRAHDTKQPGAEKQLQQMAEALGVAQMLGSSPSYVPFLKRLTELYALDAAGRTKALDAAKAAMQSVLETIEAPKGYASVWPPSIEQNGAPILLKAFEARAKVKSKETDDYIINRDPAKAKAFLATAKPVLDAVAPLGARRARFDVKYDDGPAAELPHISGMLGLTKFLAATAIAQSQTGDDASARATVRLLWSVAAAPVDEPLLITALIETIVLGVAAEATSDVFAVGKPTAEDFAAVRTALARFNAREMYDLAWRGEICMQVVALEKHILGAAASLPGMLPIETVLREDIAVGMKIIGRLRSTTTMSVRDGRDVVAEIDKSTDALPMLSALMTPAVSRSWESMISTEARVAAVKAGLDAMEFKAKNGTWPKEIKELDPFTGKPLLLRDGVVYSVGPDGKDDGGDEQKDIRFRIGR